MDSSEMSEEYLQFTCYSWFHNTYAAFRGLLCSNFSNSANQLQGNKNKAMGVQAGRSDMVLYLNGRAYMFEFKTSIGLQSKAQIEWQKIIEWQGFKYFIVRSLGDFQKIIVELI